MVNVIIGEDLKVGEGEYIIIDCGPLISATRFQNATVNWYLNQLEITNETRDDIMISEDKRFCTITESSLGVGGQIGNGGNYTCEVCSDLNTCKSNSSIIDVCGE